MPDEASLEQLRRACATPLEHPDLPTLQHACQAVSSYLLDDFRSLSEASVGDVATRSDMERLLREPPPEEGMPLNRALEEFQIRIAPYNLRPGHPRFLAFIPSAPTFVSVLGDWLCAGLNLFAGVWKEAAGAAETEIVVLDWFKSWLGYPPEARGILTSGGSEANLTALVAAREKLGWPDRQRAVLYTSEHRHWSVDRAAMVMGLRPDQIRRLPADPEQRLSPAVVYEAVVQDAAAGRVPWVVVANGGATNTGIIDPLDDLATLCQAHDMWLHVDAAYGWVAALTNEGQQALRGLRWADSVTLDPHKWFGQTFEAGGVLVRDGSLLAKTFQMRPEYMQDVAPNPDEINFADHGIALTRRFRALKIWLSVKTLGVGWFRRLVEHCCRLAEFAQVLVQQTPGFELLGRRRLSIVCFHYRPAGMTGEEVNAFNLALCEEARRTGRLFLSTTRLRDQVALRLCFVNWRTTAADVEEAIRLLQETAGRLTSRR